MDQNSRAPRTHAGVYAIAAAFLQSVPIPFVDTHLAETARSSVFRRIARSHGIHLEREARLILIRPPDVAQHGLRKRLALRAGRSLIQRFLLPARALLRFETGARTLIEAHLFELYLNERQNTRPRIGAIEASDIRTALDEATREGIPALVGALVDSLAKHGRSGASKGMRDFDAPEDDRNLVELGVDTVLDAIADLPDDLLIPFEARFRAYFQRSEP